jgi:hypothetical protein
VPFFGQGTKQSKIILKSQIARNELTFPEFSRILNTAYAEYRAADLAARKIHKLLHPVVARG